MNRRRRLERAFYLVSIILVATVVHAKDVDERKWILVKSDNFAIHSSMSKKKTVDAMNHLEALRSIFVRGGSAEELEEEKPTVIVAFGNGSDYEAVGFADDTAGMFLSELRQNFIVIRNSGSMQESQVVLHEYVHYIMQATSRFPYPKWWSEGFAEYVSSSRLSRKGFGIGLPLESRIRRLDYRGWLAWEDVIDPVRFAEYSPDQVSLFYVQSWLLVHYLHNRPDAQRSTSESLNMYLDEVQSDSDPVAAFETAFDLPLSELKSAISAYFRKGRYPYLQFQVKDVLADLDLSVTNISRSDIQVSLGDIALRRSDAEQARDWFSRSLDGSPGNVAALSGLARSYAIDGLNDDAEEYFQKALEAGPEDPLALVEFAKFSLERASSGDILFTRGDYVEQAEDLLLKARSTGASSVEIDSYLALAYMNQGRDAAEASRLLVDVVRRSPSDQWPVLLLAQLYRNEGLNDNAISMAELVLRNEHRTNSLTVAARRIISDIRGNRNTSTRPRPRIASPALPRPN